MEKDADAGPPMRQRIERLVGTYPGLHLREVARQLGTSVARIEYHVPFLEAEGRLRAERAEGRVRLYPPGVSARDAAFLAALRGRIPLQLALLLLEREPRRHAELGPALGIGKSLLSFHLRKLEAAGVVRQGPDGYALADPAGTRSLLSRHRPTPDLRTDFESLWLSFYGQGKKKAKREGRGRSP